MTPTLGCVGSGFTKAVVIARSPRPAPTSTLQAGHDWAFYFADAPLEMAMIEKITLHPDKVHTGLP